MIEITGRLLAVCQRAVREREDMKQLLQTTGECGELIAAIADYERGRVPRSKVTKEMADVLVLVVQYSLREGYATMRDALNLSLDRLEEVLRGERA